MYDYSVAFSGFYIPIPTFIKLVVLPTMSHHLLGEGSE